MRLPPTPCRVCFRPCVFNKFSHFWQKRFVSFFIGTNAPDSLDRFAAGARGAHLSARRAVLERWSGAPALSLWSIFPQTIRDDPDRED